MGCRSDLIGSDECILASCRRPIPRARSGIGAEDVVEAGLAFARATRRIDQEQGALQLSAIGEALQQADRDVSARAGGEREQGAVLSLFGGERGAFEHGADRGVQVVAYRSPGHAVAVSRGRPLPPSGRVRWRRTSAGGSSSGVGKSAIAIGGLARVVASY